MIGAPINREAIYTALYAIGSTVQWDSPLRGFRTASRRLAHWDDCRDQPGFFQVEHDDDIPTEKQGLPYRTQLEVHWVVYQNTGKDPKVVPSIENNLILDALQNAMGPRMETGVQFQDRLTLGGLVYDCIIGGRIFKDAGNLDGQGVIDIPIIIQVP